MAERMKREAALGVVGDNDQNWKSDDEDLKGGNHGDSDVLGLLERTWDTASQVSEHISDDQHESVDHSNWCNVLVDVTTWIFQGACTVRGNWVSILIKEINRTLVDQWVGKSPP